jgi:hypothetical protein
MGRCLPILYCHQVRSIQQLLPTDRTAHYRYSITLTHSPDLLEWAMSRTTGILFPARTRRNSNNHSMCKYCRHIYIQRYVNNSLSSSIFVIDRHALKLILQCMTTYACISPRSGSMSLSDRSPLQNTPVTARIAARCNNRLGAVYSSLYAFWSSRQNVVNQSSSQQVPARRDAYSVLLFDHEVMTCLANNFTMSPDQLLNAVLAHTARGGTDYTSALKSAQTVMMAHWSTERCRLTLCFFRRTNRSHSHEGPL